MSDQESIRDAEAAVDESFVDCDLTKSGFAQSAWTILSVNEDAHLKALSQLPSKDLPVFADIRLNALTYPMRVCAQRCRKGEKLDRRLIDADYTHAHDWLDIAEHYSQFCTIFPMWHRKQIGLSVEGTRLVVEQPVLRSRQYEAYNRIILNEARSHAEIPLVPDVVERQLVRATARDSDSFCIAFNPGLVASLVAWMGPYVRSHYSLPKHWSFLGFTLADFRSLHTVVVAMLLAWHNTRTHLASKGMPGMGYCSSVWVVAKDELIARLTRYSRVERAKVVVILDLLTFGNHNVREPDIATQPLVDLTNGFYALAPFVWLHSSAERNLCVLLNHIPEQRDLYARLTDEKEHTTRREIEAYLAPLGYSFANGNVGSTDVDLAVIDHREKCCLCLELKWFIEPAEAREIRERTMELNKGIQQAKVLKTLFGRADKRLVEDLLKISTDYEFVAAVASQNWIGLDNAQDEEVAVIKVWHIIRQIAETGSLRQAMQWLDNRDYLPREGSDYSVRPMEIACGQWRATWYGIEPMSTAIQSRPQRS
jgi:hypothetical protein